MEYKDMLNALYARHNLITSLADTIEKKLKSFPSGRIEIKHIGNKYYYYYVTGNTKTQLLDADNKLIYELIQKNYLEKVIKAARKELTVIDGVKHHYPETVVEDIYDSLSQERRKYTKPIIPSYEQFLNEWQNRPFEPKQIKEGTPVFETMRGEHVRSKSEQLIADRLFVNGIPYKYECPLKVGNKIIHPDFTILRKSDRNEIYHEHLGKTDNNRYQIDNVPRLNDYILNGFLLGEKLFLSFESSTKPLDIRVIDKMINEQFR